MRLIDTHSHIDVEVFAHDFHEVLTRTRAAGVIAQILPGIRQTWWDRLLFLCQKEDDLHPAIGLHPMYLDVHLPEHLLELRSHAESGKLVAIGEIGLDFFVKDFDQNRQQELFEAQLDIAKEACLPVLLHVRKAHDQVLSIIRQKGFPHGGIIHAFGGSMQQAENYLKRGFLIGFGGSVTYTRAKKIRRIAQALPLESIVLETDAPDLPPAGHHGQRNSPEYLAEILKILAELRVESLDEIACMTTQNASRLLHIRTPPPSNNG